MTKNRYILITILGFCSGLLLAQDKVTNVNYSNTLTTLAPVLQSPNPAALYYSPIDSIGKLSVGYSSKYGDFKPTMYGNKKNNLNIHTESIIRLNKTILQGKFDYNNSTEKNTQYSNLFETYHSTPYLFVDTVEGVDYSREMFDFVAQIAQPVNDDITLAAKINYMVGQGAQNRDPRALNKITKLNTQAGILYNLNNYKIGINVNYSYYNEDIDISIVEENKTHTLFALTGLGTYSCHNTKSFYRLYQRNTYGADIQIISKNNIFSIGGKTFIEDIKDGRKNSSATWAVIKHDSRYQGHTINALDVLTIKQNDFYHQITLKGNFSVNIGTEYLQDLEYVDKENLSTEQWVTLSKDAKYWKNETDLLASYKFSKYNNLWREYELIASANYYQTKEKYEYNKNKIAYSNLDLAITGNKNFLLRKSKVEVILEGGYNINLDKEISLPYQNFISEKIIIPDYHYFTSNYIHSTLQLCYAWRFRQNKNIYINTKYHLSYNKDWEIGDKTCSFWNFAVGVKF